MGFVQRTHSCGELRVEHAGQQVTLNGWAHRVRDLGGVLFIDFRDRTGLVQLTFVPTAFPNRGELRNETCLSVNGKVKGRTEETKNPRMGTGDIEIVVNAYSVLGSAKPLPFPVSDEEQMQAVNEELRVKHRYLDLRRPTMYRRLAIRSSLVRRMHRFLDERGFLEVETPIITKSTPEGARDYLVPYRLDAGKWYALPQSPQQYKQLLMVAGIERYYQIARCFRDESSRADRQPEFSQLDIEMSFVTQEQILSLTEELTVEVINGVVDEFGLEKAALEPFERLTYDEAMHLFGSDKPDLRFGLRLFDLTEAVAATEFGVFKNTLEGGGVIRGVVYPGGAELSRKDINALDEFCKEFGAKGMAWLALEHEPGENTTKTPHGSLIRGSIAKFFLPEELDAIVKASSAAPGDLICMIADSYAAANNVLYRLRLEIGNRKGLRDPKVLKFCWIVDFPLVEWDTDAGRWSPSHHPFTMPKEEDLVYLETDPGRIRADC